MPVPSTQARKFGILDRASLILILVLAAAVAIMTVGLFLSELATPSASFRFELADGGIPGFTNAAAGLETAAYSHAELTPTALSPEAMGWSTAAAALGLLAALAVCAVMFLIALNLFRGRPFTRTVTWGLAVMGLAILVNSLYGPLFMALARAQLAEDLGLADPDAAPGQEHLLGQGFAFDVDAVPVILGMMLVILAAAFQIGERMQRDTEGLV